MACVNKGKKGENGPPVVMLFEGVVIEIPIIDDALRRQVGSESRIIPTGRISSGISLCKANITAGELIGPLEGKQIGDLVRLIDHGDAYVNVHTEQNRKGEIRGQVTAATK